jgi:Zn-dependent protease
VLLPIMLLLASNGALTFGYAKPVPVNFWRLQPRRLGVGLVAAAGPGTNFALAVISVLLLHILPFLPDGVDAWMQAVLVGSIIINLILCLFNLIPMPPLDGGRILAALLPQGAQAPLARLERYGFLILIAALFLLPWVGNQVGIDLDIFQWLVGDPALRIGDWLVRAAGV